ncbi:MAG: hypothetical protein ABI232_06140 [Jatrophihabitantaceae bacterium]
MNTDHRPITPETARRLTLDAEPWLSCDDCFRYVDRYVDDLLAGVPAPMPAMRAHLTGCNACYEEARSLVLLAAHEQNLSPNYALSSLTQAP